MKSSKILLKDGQTVELVDNRINDGDIASWNSKQNSLTAGDNVTISENTISSNQVFVATYGKTTYQEIKDAYYAGKICVLFNNEFYYYINLINTEKIRFITQSPNPSIPTLEVSSANRWSFNTVWLQTRLTFDAEPKAGSKNPVTSDGIKTAIETVNAKGLTIKEISGEQVICFE